MQEIKWNTKDGREVVVKIEVVEYHHTNYGETYRTEYLYPVPEVFLAGKKLPYLINGKKDAALNAMGITHNCGPLGIHKDNMARIKAALESEISGHAGYQAQKAAEKERDEAREKYEHQAARNEEICENGFAMEDIKK